MNLTLEPLISDFVQLGTVIPSSNVNLIPNQMLPFNLTLTNQIDSNVLQGLICMFDTDLTQSWSNTQLTYDPLTNMIICQLLVPNKVNA